MSRKSYGLQSIDLKITNLIKPLFQGSKKEFVLINNLVKNWEEIVGKKYAAFCYPKMVSFGKDKSENAVGGKLTIAAYNSAVGFFLESNSEFILERIASFYGFKSITKIILKQEPKSLDFHDLNPPKLSADKEKFLQERTLEVEDLELNQVLQKLGREIIRN